MSEKIGEILQKLGYLTADQVEEILTIQKEKIPEVRFGKIALDNGFVNDDAINAYVEYVHEKEGQG
ncbi:MAG: hypothetical protein GY754_08640 [bacterium]|nr:hypothetical protein [bacterium]